MKSNEPARIPNYCATLRGREREGEKGRRDRERGGETGRGEERERRGERERGRERFLMVAITTSTKSFSLLDHPPELSQEVQQQQITTTPTKTSNVIENSYTTLHEDFLTENRQFKGHN